MENDVVEIAEHTLPQALQVFPPPEIPAPQDGQAVCPGMMAWYLRTVGR